MISFKIILGQSLWPIELSITSLPPHIRMNVDYLLLGGIWLGPVKPDMRTILQQARSKQILVGQARMWVWTVVN